MLESIIQDSSVFFSDLFIFATYSAGIFVSFAVIIAGIIIARKRFLYEKSSLSSKNQCNKNSTRFKSYKVVYILLHK